MSLIIIAVYWENQGITEILEIDFTFQEKDRVHLLIGSDKIRKIKLDGTYLWTIQKL